MAPRRPEKDRPVLAGLLALVGVAVAIGLLGGLAVMVGVMTLTGAVVVDHQHHAAGSVFPVIGAHVLGMYALVIFVGDLVDRIGRPRALVGGLLLMAGASLGLLAAGYLRQSVYGDPKKPPGTI